MKKQWKTRLLSALLGGVMLFGSLMPVKAATSESASVAVTAENAVSVADVAEESAECASGYVQTATKLPEGFAGENLEKAEYSSGINQEEIDSIVEETENIESISGVKMEITEDTSDENQEDINTGTVTITIKECDAAFTTSDNAFFVNFHTKSSYEITEYVEVGTGNEGYVSGAYGADAIYLGMVNGQVKFMMSGVIGVVSADEVELVSKEEAASFSFYEVVNGILVHRITTNMSLSNYSGNLKNGPAPDYLEAGVEYYSYDGHYFYTDLDTMAADYKSGIRDNSVNPEDPFFNYFQYLPMRSYSEYSVDELTELINSRVSDTSKLKDLGDTFVEMQNSYGVNALLATGLAASESGWGTSTIAQTKNNLFGINAVDATPGESANYYKTVESCVKDFMETLMSKQYFNPDNWKYRGAFLGNKASGVNLNYASDPYWGEKVAAIAWLLDGYGENKDAYLYTIGIKDPICSEHTNMNIRRLPDISATRIHRTGTQPCHAFLIIDPEPENGYYKIQSEPVLTACRNGIARGTGAYNKYSMYLYAASDYITIVSEGTKEDVNKIEYKDVPEDSWYYKSVKYVVENGIMAGLSYDVFGPFDTLTRAQLPVILYRLEGSPDVAFSKKFTDVPSGTWYTAAILWASENGIVSGYTNGAFGVNDSITREQMAVMMYRYARYKEYSVDDKAPLDDFKDVKKISSYATNALSWAVGSRLLFGKEDGTLISPQDIANRSEGAAVIMRFANCYS